MSVAQRNFQKLGTSEEKTIDALPISEFLFDFLVEFNVQDKKAHKHFDKTLNFLKRKRFWLDFADLHRITSICLR